MRVLIVSYFFPPAGGGGVQRVLKWARYLPEFGVEVDVLAPDDPRWRDRDEDLVIPEGTTVHRAPYRGFSPGRAEDIVAERSGMTRVATRGAMQLRRFAIPDPSYGWRFTAVKVGAKVVRERKIDVVVGTSPPATDLFIARLIAKKTGIPWAADYRDSWLQDPRLRINSALVRSKNAVNRALAKRLMRDASLVTTAAEVISDEMNERYPALVHRTHTILNGVDLEDYEGLPKIEHPSKCVIVHAGSFFGQRDIRPFLSALKRLIARRPLIAESIDVRIVGQLRTADEQFIASDSVLNSIVTRVGFVPYKTSLSEQVSADRLLLLIPPGSIEAGVPSGKLFEYLAARRRILGLVPPGGAAADLIDQADAGVVIDPGSDKAIEHGLEAEVDRWLDKGKEMLAPSDEVDRLISRRGRAEQLATLLHGLTPK